MAEPAAVLARAYTRCHYGQLHYLESVPRGAAIAPTLVLLHQNPSSSLEYAGLVAAMATDRRVIAFDTPGYGMSDPPPGPLTMAQYAAAFAQGLAAMGVTAPIDAYGFHTGALLAIELALTLPTQVRRIAMTGIPMHDAARRAELLAQVSATPPPTEDGAGVMATAAKLWDYVVAQRMPGVPLANAVAAFADKHRWFYRSGWAYHGVWAYDYDRLRLVEQPACLVQPAEALGEVSRAAAGLLRDCTIVDLPDLDRDIFETGLPAIAAALRAFFTDLPGVEA